MAETDTSDYKGYWKIDSTYLDAQIVLFNNTLYLSSQNNNTGKQPDSIQYSSYWTLYNNEVSAITGWTLRGGNISIKNCEVHNCYNGIGNMIDTINNVIVDGLTCYNVINAIYIKDYPIRNSYFTNIKLINPLPGANNYLLYLYGVNIDNTLSFGTLEGVNSRGVLTYKLSGNNFINIDKLTSKGYSIYSLSQYDTLNIKINNLISQGDGYNSNIINITDTLNSLIIESWTATDNKTSIASIAGNMNLLKIGNLYTHNLLSMSQGIIVTDTISNIIIDNAYAAGAGSYSLLNFSGSGRGINTLIGQIGGLFSSEYTGTRPTIYSTKGHLNSQNFLTENIEMTNPDTWLEAFRKRPFYICDFMNVSTSGYDPWFGTSVLSGILANVAAGIPHQGAAGLRTSANANSGYSILTSPLTFTVSGDEITEAIIKTVKLDGTTTRFGFHDATTITAPVDGAYFEIGPDSLCYGKTMKASSGSSTGTSYQMTDGAWYRLKLVVNSDATQINYYIYNDAGTLLWGDQLTTNIPTDVYSGHGLITTNEGTTADVYLIHLDYMMLYFGTLAR
jgi:hypothetical protein